MFDQDKIKINANSTSGSSDALITVQDLSKKFCRSFKRSLWYGVQDIVSELNPFSKQLVDASRKESFREGEFWAVSDVSFELHRGECLGLIGHNGAGKTTLLKMLNGLIKPDKGSITVRGRMGALIALGTGFNPILSGRENIYVNGSILGLSKSQIQDKIDDIIDFSQIGDFIDSPVQSYSSGMQVRLGFAVATSLEPDVLLLDEVLAVGDASFRHRCYHRINKLIKKCAVIFVSHSMDSIGAICSSVGLMDHGRFELYKRLESGIAAYNDLMRTDSDLSSNDGGAVFEIYPPVISARVVVENPVVEYGGTLEITIHLELKEAMRDVVLTFHAMNSSEQWAIACDSRRVQKEINLVAGMSMLRLSVPNLYLHDGLYRWALWIGLKGSIEANVYAMRAGVFSVKSIYPPISNIPYLPAIDISFEDPSV